jgi:isopentenyldiphosphate isomerase
MQEELIDFVDEAGQPLGVAPKRLVHQLGLWHYSMHCWVYRTDSVTGKTFLLFQKRSQNKSLFPGLLDISAAGHYQAGEKPEDSVREISEELGLTVRYDELRYVGMRTEVIKVGDILNREFSRVYLLRTELQPQVMNPSSQEISALMEISIVDGLALWSGEASTASAAGIEYRSGAWVPSRDDVSVDLFVPRLDFYYLKVFLLARAASQGERYLAV